VVITLLIAIGGTISSLASQRDYYALLVPRRPLGGSQRLTWRLAMTLRIICMCGYVIQGDDDDELWRNAQGHMGVLHPELVGNVTREDILAQAEQL
jgi:predicted small metal-binding protein